MPNSRRVFAFAFCLLLLPLSLSAQRVISEISGNFDTFGLAINTLKVEDRRMRVLATGVVEANT
jgi:hypothetical protein